MIKSLLLASQVATPRAPSRYSSPSGVDHVGRDLVATSSDSVATWVATCERANSLIYAEYGQGVATVATSFKTITKRDAKRGGKREKRTYRENNRNKSLQSLLNHRFRVLRGYRDIPSHTVAER